MAAGTDSLQSKTLPQTRERNEATGENRRGVVVVEAIVKPVVVPVPPVAVPVEVANDKVAARVAVTYKTPPIPLPFEYS